MQVWPLLTVLCSAVAVAISYPLIRRYESSLVRAQQETAIYASQLAEVQTDLAAENISTTDAEKATSEIQRRMAAAATIVESRHPLRGYWRGLALASTAGLVILGSVNLYGYLGRPDVASAPGVGSATSVPVEVTPATVSGLQQTASVKADTPGQVNDMVRRLAERLKAEPNDAEGWRMLGWSYFNLQNYVQSADAYKTASELDPRNAEYKSSYAEALVQAAGGTVTPRAQSLIAEVLTNNPEENRARFYDALAREQAGDQNGALDRWIALLADAPGDANWRDDVKIRIADLGKATGRDVQATLALPSLQPNAQGSSLGQGEKDAMVDGMIAQLAQKLAANPKDRDGWAMMIRSLTVRGDKAGAEKVLADALAIFKDDPETVQGLKAIASGRTIAATPWAGAASGSSAVPAGAAAPDLKTVDQNAKAAIETAAPAAQQEMIRGMVAKLAARLDSAPDDSDGWIRLMRSYMVLNDRPNAKQALDKARNVFANDAAKLAQIEAAASALGVN